MIIDKSGLMQLDIWRSDFHDIFVNHKIVRTYLFTYWLADRATLAPYARKTRRFSCFSSCFSCAESGSGETGFKQDYSMYTRSNEYRLMSIDIMVQPQMYMYVKG